MIKAVKFINPNGNNVVTRLNGLEQGPFVLWGIEGLDPGEADINVTELATVDGAVFNMARQSSREMTFTLILNWFDNGSTTSIQAAREEVYKYFPLKKIIRAVFYLDDTSSAGRIIAYATEGYVKANPVDIFAKTCAAKVTIIRTDPLFYEYDDNLYVDDIIGFNSVTVSDYSLLKAGMSTNYPSAFKLTYEGAPPAFKWHINDIEASSFNPNNIGISVSPNLNSMPNTFNVKGNPDYLINKAYFTSPSILDNAIIENTGSEELGCDIVIPFKQSFANTNTYLSPSKALKDCYSIEIEINQYASLNDMTLNNPSAKIILYPNKISQYPTFNISGNPGYILQDDVLVISTGKGHKNVTLTRGNVSSSVLGVLSSDNIINEKWMSIFKGTTYYTAVMKVTPTSGGSTASFGMIFSGITYQHIVDNVPNTFHIQYRNAKRGL